MAENLEENEINSQEHDKKIQKRLRIIFLVAGVAILGAIGVRVVTTKLNPGQETLDRIFATNVMTVETGDLQEYFSINGEVTAENTINVYPNTMGKIDSYLVKVGQNVVKDQQIAFIDPNVPGASFRLSPVTAPRAGTITSLPLELGNTVSLSTVIAQIGDLSKLKIDAYIPERFAKTIEVNTTAEVTFSALPGQTYQAYMAEVAPVVDTVSRTVQSKLYVTDRSDDLLAGMFGNLKINTVLHQDTIIIPTNALVTRSGKNYIFIVDEEATKSIKSEEKASGAAGSEYDAVVRMAEAVLGANVDGLTQILEPVVAGDRIIISGQNLLSEGAKVRFSNEIEPASSNATNDAATEETSDDAATSTEPVAEAN